MDIRIQGESLEGTSALQPSRTQETPLVGQDERQRGLKAMGGGQDSVHISGLSAQISKANQLHDAQASNRVLTLAALYARGDYHVETRDLSRALVSHALSGVVEGGQA